MTVLTKTLQQAEAAFVKSMAATIDGDPYRQGFHLMPPAGFLNDPNGLCYFGGRAHVFYQYAPFDPLGGLKLWGHYSSADMLHWTQHSPAVWPDCPYDCHGAYSGSAIEKEGKLHLFYTGNVRPGADPSAPLRHQNVLQVSSEDGVVFGEKTLHLTPNHYPEGLSTHVRDPKLWLEEGIYYMLLGARTEEDEGKALVFTSIDLQKWSYSHALTNPQYGYMWECPDYFILDGQKLFLFSPQGIKQEETRLQNLYQSGICPLSASPSQADCTLGDFYEIDYGFDFYAPQTFCMPDGRRILLGWMSVSDTPYVDPTIEKGWQNCLTLPRQLSFQNGRLWQSPLAELAALRGACVQLPLSGGAKIQPQSGRSELVVDFATCPTRFSFRLSGGAYLRYDGALLQLGFDDNTGAGRKSRVLPLADLKSLQIFCDHSSVEVFAEGYTMTTRCYGGAGQFMVDYCDVEGKATLYSLAGYQYTKK